MDDRFKRQLNRWAKKLKTVDAQSYLLLRLVLESAGTFRGLEAKENFTDENRRHMCGMAATLVMDKLRKAMKEEPWAAEDILES